MADISKKLSDFIDTKDFAVGKDLTFVDFSLFELIDFIEFASNGKTFQEYENLL